MSIANRIQDILSNQLPNHLEDQPVVTKGELTNRTEQNPVGDAEILTETSTGSGKVALPAAYLDRVTRGAFRTLGVTEDDVILNLGAPQPHLSGIGMKRGGEALGAEVLTDHAGELEDIVERSHEVTTVISLPGMAKAKGQEIAERWGDPAEIFSPDTAIMAGETVTDSWRAFLTEQWGFDDVGEFYASSEVGPILAEAGSDEIGAHRQLVPQLDEVIVEIYPLRGDELTPPDSADITADELVDIREIDRRTEGILYPTVPTVVQRYDQGDLVQVTPGDEMGPQWPDELPAVEPLGRIGCLNIAGAMVPEGKMERTITQASSNSSVEWTIRATGTKDRSTLEIYVDEQLERNRFERSLETNAHDLYYANKHGMIEAVQLHHVADPLDRVPQESGLKTTRIADNRTQIDR